MTTRILTPGPILASGAVSRATGLLSSAARIISFSKVSKQYGRQVLFVDASFQLNPGEKAGLVGPNGAGKTTVFRMVTGEEHPDEVIDGDVGAPSGGWMMRVAMARILLGRPDVLLMDEPTNHLDIATKEMLVTALHEIEGTMLFVSHDRTFLRGLANRVLEIGGEDGSGRPVTYDGSYEEYVARSRHEAPGVHA